MRTRFHLVACLCAGLLSAGSATGASIVIDAGSGLSANAQALAAFNRAAAQWGSLLADPVTVTIKADLSNMGSSTILGSTNAVLLSGGYNMIRDQMVADAADEASNAVVSLLPTAAQFSAYLPAGFGLGASMVATKANLKAMGFTGLDAFFGAVDATITFNSGFNFYYGSGDSVTAGLYDFETIAEHEIAHVLGFISAVDTIDYYLGQNQPTSVYLDPLDLFRFGGATPSNASEFTSAARNLVPGTDAYFADLGNRWALSTGADTGDGRQASHWKDDQLSGSLIGIMDPTLAAGTRWPISAADIRALDVIGWDPAALNVAEPGSVALLAVALLALAARRRRSAV